MRLVVSQVPQPLGDPQRVIVSRLRHDAAALWAADADDAHRVDAAVGCPAPATQPAYHLVMPIKLWSDEAQAFVDTRTGEPVTADELIELAVAYRTLPADRQAVRRA